MDISGAPSSTTIGPALGGDRPKESSSEDRLGLGAFARALATSVLRTVPRDGFVIAVHGAWGSGKTSAVNMAVEALERMQDGAEPSVVVVRFNPWWFSGQEDLTRAFFTEVSVALDRRVTPRVVDGFRALARRVAGLRKVVGAGVALVPGGAPFKDAVESSIEALGAAAADGGSLTAARDGLAAALRAQDRRILVVIDDVDRLPDDEARQVFRLVKSVADLPNVVHLLVFDREVARRAVAPGPSADGPQWLEKVVQASFDLPAPHRVDLQGLFLERLEAIVGADAPLQPERWPDVFHTAIAPWLRTPRDATRLANAVAIVWPVVRDKVDLADFVAVEALRLFEPRVYDVVRGAAPGLTGVGGDGDELDRLAGELLDAAGGRADDVRRSLTLLFPRLERVWANSSYGDGFMAGWDKARRICSGRRFPSYFNFELDDDVLGAEERDDLVRALLDADALASLADRLGRRERRGGGTRAELALDELAHDGELTAAVDAPAAARTLLQAGDAFLPEREGRSFTSVPVRWRLGWAVEALLRRLPLPGRVDVLVEAMAGSPSLRTLSGAMSSALAHHGRAGREPARPPDERIVDADGLATMRRAFLDRIAVEATGAELGANRDLGMILGLWRDLAGDAAARDWVADFVRTDEGLIAFADRFTGTGVGGAMGSHAQLEFPVVHRDSVSSLADLDEVVVRLRGIRESTTGDRASIADRFLRGLETVD